MDLGLTTRRADTGEGDGVPVVACTGELDLTTAPRLRDALLRLATAGERRVVADLSGIVFIDSIGLGVVVASLKRFRALGGELYVVIGDRIRTPFEITGLTAAFPLYTSVDDATTASRA
ncbi:MAG: STAS domain-containing protein [Acidimicrobiales bacterium]